MRKILLPIVLVFFWIVSNGQEHRDHLEGGNHAETLVGGLDYYVHVDHNTFVGLYGKCRNLTLELDGKSGIRFEGVQVTGDVTIQSINGESWIEESDPPKNYPNDTVYRAGNLIVRHFDNPKSYISLQHLAFKVAYLGSPDVHDLIDLNFENGIHAEFKVCIDCASINGGGKLDLVVIGGALGTILGQTKVSFVQTKWKFKPNLDHLRHPDCGNCISTR